MQATRPDEWSGVAWVSVNVCECIRTECAVCSCNRSITRLHIRDGSSRNKYRFIITKHYIVSKKKNIAYRFLHYNYLVTTISQYRYPSLTDTHTHTHSFRYVFIFCSRWFSRESEANEKRFSVACLAALSLRAAATLLWGAFHPAAVRCAAARVI